MILFDNNPLNQLSLEEQEFFLAITMSQFREFPLCGGGYDEEGLRFYDGVLGDLMRRRDKMFKMHCINQMKEFKEFCANWEYHGDIYRVLSTAYVYPKNGEPFRRMPTIKWHGMIASWSSSYDFTKNFNHISPNTKYKIIHANTKNSAGIDVNKFSEYLGCYNYYTASENEVIFPMKKEFVVNVYKNITPIEFKKIMENISDVQK